MGGVRRQADSLEADFLAIDGALAALRKFDPDLGRVVECHLYGGMSLEAIADALSLPHRTVRKRWVRARTLLIDVLEGHARGSAPPSDSLY